MQHNNNDKLTTAKSSEDHKMAAGSAPGVAKDEGGLPSSMIVIFISLVIDLLAFTMILPLLPAILDYYGKNDKDGLYSSLSSFVNGFREMVGAPDTPRWNAVLFGGLIGSLFSLLQFIASPMIGALSDVYGRKRVLVWSMVGVAVSYLLWAVSSNFSLFVISRIVGGISKGNVSISMAVVTDVLPQERRGKGMALVGVAFSIGFLLGPMIGAFFAMYMRSQTEQDDMFFSAPAILALFLAIIDIIFLCVYFKETLPSDKRAPSLGSGVQRAVDLINPLALFQFKAVDGIPQTDMKSMQETGLVYFIYLFVYSGLEFTLTFLTHNRFNYDSMKQGRMFVFIGTIMMLVQGGYVRRLKQGMEKKMAVRGMVTLIPSFLLVGFAYNEGIFYLGLLLFAFASATVVPCVTTLISSHGSVEQKGTVMGIFRSLGALARAFGPVVASTLYWSAGERVCYIVGATAMIVPFLWLRKIKVSDVSAEEMNPNNKNGRYNV